MVRGKGTQISLSEAERANIQEEIQELDETIKGNKEGYGAGNRGEGLNISGMQGEKKRLEKILDESAPRGLTDKKKDDLIREGKRLLEMMMEGLPTKEEMRFPAKYPGAIQKHMKWESLNRTRVARYKELQHIVQDYELLPYYDTVRKEK